MVTLALSALSFVLVPQTAELPQTALKAWVVLVPQTAEFPQTAEVPFRKTELPHTAELPQTADVFVTRYTLALPES